MKKFLLFSVLASSSLYAQVREKGTIEVSPFVGASTANYYGDSSTKNNKAIITPSFGINGIFYFNDRVSIKSGIEYRVFGSSYGVEKRIANPNPPEADYYVIAEAKDKIETLNIPLHFSYYIGKNRRWNVMFGPSVSFVVKAKSNGFDMMEQMNKVQAGLQFGAGYKFYNTEKFSLTVEYQEYLGASNNLNKNAGSYNPVIANLGASVNLRASFKVN